jgi:hypothetical protein
MADVTESPRKPLFRPFLDAFLTATAGAIGAAVLQFGSAFFLADNGLVVIGPPIHIANQVYQTVDASNFSDDLLSGLIFVVPNSVDVNRISSSSPVSIKKADETAIPNPESRIEVSGLEPRRLTRLLIPLEDQTGLAEIRLLKAASKRLSIERSTELRGRIERIATNVTAGIISTGVLMFVIMYIAGRIFAASDTAFTRRYEEVVRSLDEARERSEDLGKQISTTRDAIQRINLLLMARITDLSKELTFWRDTIRKIIYTSGRSKLDAEEILKLVSSHLGTQSTHGRSDDFEATLLLARLLATPKSAPESAD